MRSEIELLFTSELTFLGTRGSLFSEPIVARINKIVVSELFLQELSPSDGQ